MDPCAERSCSVWSQPVDGLPLVNTLTAAMWPRPIAQGHAGDILKRFAVTRVIIVRIAASLSLDNITELTQIALTDSACSNLQFIRRARRRASWRNT